MKSHYHFSYWLAISARPAGTWPDKKRVKYGFKKKKPKAGSGVFQNLAQTRTGPGYIYSY